MTTSTEKVALVTGSAMGIGLACAELLAAEGFRTSPDVLQVIVNGSSQRMFDYIDDGAAIHLIEDGGEV